MKPDSTGKRILLIDQQQCWREIAASTLRSAGFFVCTFDSYNYAFFQECLQGVNPDLVVLGCTQIRSEEERLIAQILAHKHHLLVLCTFLPWPVMRSLFLQGVDDVVDKPDDPAYLINFVHIVLASTVPRNSYQAVERAGVA